MKSYWIIPIIVVAAVALTLIYLAAGCAVTRFVSKRRPELFTLGDEYFVLLAIIVVMLWPIWSLFILIAWATRFDRLGQNTEGAK